MDTGALTDTGLPWKATGGFAVSSLADANVTG